MIALIMSFIFPGLGQLVQNKPFKAMFFMVSGIVSLCLCLVWIGFLLFPVVWLINMVDVALEADYQRRMDNWRTQKALRRR